MRQVQSVRLISCSGSRGKSDVSLFKVLQGDDEWGSNWNKSMISVVTKDRDSDNASRERIMKKYIFAFERDYSGDQLIKHISKMMISLFLQKSHKASCKQGNYILSERQFPLLFSSLEERCDNLYLNFVKT